MVQFEGTYKRTSSENYEEFLSKLGVGLLLRKAAMASTPTMTVTKQADAYWVFKTSTTLKDVIIKFKVGEDWEEDMPDGRHVKCSAKWEGNELTISQKATQAGKKDTITKRIFEDNGIQLIITCEDVVCKQYFTRQ